MTEVTSPAPESVKVDDTVTVQSSSDRQPSPEIPPAAPMAFDTSSLGVDSGLVGASSSGGFDSGTDAQEFGFDDDSVSRYEFELYKGRKGITDRIGILALPYGARVHFKQGIGYFQCLSVYETKTVAGQKVDVLKHTAPCCKHCDAPRKRFIVPLIQYSTQPNGALTPQFGYVLKAWLYSDDKYAQLRQIHKEFPLLEHDILVTCQEEAYQRISISVCREAVWKAPKLAAAMPGLAPEVKNWVETMRPKMAKKLGKKITEREFLEKAGLAAPATLPAGLDAPMVDVKGLLDGLV